MSVDPFSVFVASLTFEFLPGDNDFCVERDIELLASDLDKSRFWEYLSFDL